MIHWLLSTKVYTPIGGSPVTLSQSSHTVWWIDSILCIGLKTAGISPYKNEKSYIPVGGLPMTSLLV